MSVNQSLARRGPLFIGLGLWLGSLATGCGDPNGAITVSGSVSYDGHPVVGEIQFVPDIAGTRSATGTLDSSGKFRLSSFGSNDGALPGKYKVAVISRGPDKPVSAKNKGKMMAEDMQGSGDELIPKKYFVAETSGLTAEVSPSSREFSFDLKR